ncbi:cerato-platanin [Auricularia subglabra TFB-10046 SS5]|nr:cerato-platanin [Auricularia subglabra TFB-10046 SS5]
MRVLALLATALSAAGIVSAAKGAVTYDTVYDNSKLSTNLIACSDGKNGLRTKGYKTIGALPSFPNVGGAPAIAGWNSKKCGTCWNVVYKGRNVTFTAIDAAKTINLSKKAVNYLTKNQAVKLGTVQATYTQVDASACGL